MPAKARSPSERAMSAHSRRVGRITRLVREEEEKRGEEDFAHVCATFFPAAILIYIAVLLPNALTRHARHALPVFGSGKATWKHARGV